MRHADGYGFGETGRTDLALQQSLLAPLAGEGTRNVIAVVEEFAPRLATALEGFGFEARGECIVLVKSIAQRVLESIPGAVVE